MIYGTRIRLRAVERHDLPRFVSWLNDPDVRENLQMLMPLSEAQEESWFVEMLKQPLYEQPLVIEVRDGSGWIAVGDCSFHKIDWRIAMAEVGIFIGDRAYWNLGYGTEAMQLLLDIGFKTLNLNRVFLRVYETNPRAIRAYEKAGFVHEGRLRQAEFRNGRYIDVLLMSVLRSEWQAPGGEA